jgi:hypothetical protein
MEPSRPGVDRTVLQRANMPRRHHSYEREIGQGHSRVSAGSASELPLRGLLCATLSLAFVYHVFLVELPGDLGADSLLGKSLSTVVVSIGGSPLVAFALFVLVLAPGLIYTRSSRHYYGLVVLTCLVFVGLSLAVTRDPLRAVRSRVEVMLSAGRDLPRMLAGD